MKVHITAAEASGDLLGREVIEAIRGHGQGQHPYQDICIAGIGGAEMAAAGIDSPIDIAPLSVLGLVEGLRAYGDVKRLVAEAADAIIAFEPDVAVMIDSWGFTIRLAQAVRARAPQIRLVKLIGPQVWASRPGRAKTLARHFDHLLAMTEMEPPLYAGTGLAVTVIGAPALSRTVKGDGAAFRAAHDLNADAPLLLVLPGSRASEIDRVAPVLMAAADRCRSLRPGLEVVAMPAQAVMARFREQYGATSGVHIIDAGQEAGQEDGEARTGRGRHDAMAAADAALACSGTVTSELAVQGTPMVVGYKIGWMTWAIARFLLYKHRHITLLNIASGDRSIVPEFVQTGFTPDRLSDAALAILDDPARAAAQVEAQNRALTRMGYGGPPVADLAAAAILQR
ncbi:MAG: lipid-A-disaccharide synthase [Pseudomonadota bacterium]